MNKENFTELIALQYSLLRLISEEKNKQKTAIEATNNCAYQLHIAAFKSVNKIVLEYLA